MFVSERGSPFTTAGFARMIERVAAGAGLEIKAHPHMLRHACGYALANKGHDARAIRRRRMAAGKCFEMLGVFAEFETNLRRERQLGGIAKAKAAGVYKGRPASIDAAQVRAMKAEGKGASEIAKALKIGRASAYRALEAS